MEQQESIIISKATYENKIYLLDPPIELTVFKFELENLYIAEYPELDLFCSGSNIPDLLDDINASIIESYEIYALEENKNMTDKAVELKNKMLTRMKVAKS